MGQDEPVIVGTSSHRVVAKVLLCGFLCPKVFQRVGPQEVTHRAKRRRFFEAIQLLVCRGERGVREREEKEGTRGRENGEGRGMRESDKGGTARDEEGKEGKEREGEAGGRGGKGGRAGDGRGRRKGIQRGRETEGGRGRKDSKIKLITLLTCDLCTFHAFTSALQPIPSHTVT